MKQVTIRGILRTILLLLVVAQLCSGANDDQGEGDDTAVYQNTNGYVYLKNCEDNAVEVTSVKLLCDSPYTFYYGNGAHRNSPQCDYGDKARITVYFNVTEDLGSDVYMTMAVYAATGDYELLYALRAAEVCNNLVGSTCNTQGQYAFSMRVQFDYLYGDNQAFYPVVEMGFSTKPDEGYNLGGSNIDCWYNEESEQYDPWIYTDTTKVKSKGGQESFLANYGTMIGAFTLLFAFAFNVWRKIGNEVEYKGKLDQMDLLGSSKFGSCD
jgi:hypothetical protein